jgi:hypothetical protein
MATINHPDDTEERRKRVLLEYFIDNDKDFDRILYSCKIQEVSEVHWTPIIIAKRAAELLVDSPDDRILDIGSGVGKFCISAALHLNANYFGVEQRKSLCEIAISSAQAIGLAKATFIHSNIKDVQFQDYDAFYFFNPFLENIHTENRIDATIPLVFSLYQEYTRFVRAQFLRLPVGTKVVTYCSNDKVIPSPYQRTCSEFNDRLVLWTKTS